MKANDLGLSVYQMRLLTCAQIVRKATTPFDMYNWECGTSHCAIGDYCQAGVSDMRLVNGIPALPSGETHSKAVLKEMGISIEEHIDLFGATHVNASRTRKQVADRIEHFALHEHADAKVMV